MHFSTCIENIPIRNAANKYDPGNVTILLDNLVCQGDEESLLHCPSRQSINQHICSSSQVAGVVCGGLTRP